MKTAALGLLVTACRNVAAINLSSLGGVTLGSARSLVKSSYNLASTASFEPARKVAKAGFTVAMETVGKAAIPAIGATSLDSAKRIVGAGYAVAKDVVVPASGASFESAKNLAAAGLNLAKETAEKVEVPHAASDAFATAGQTMKDNAGMVGLYPPYSHVWVPSRYPS